MKILMPIRPTFLLTLSIRPFTKKTMVFVIMFFKIYIVNPLLGNYIVTHIFDILNSSIAYQLCEPMLHLLSCSFAYRKNGRALTPRAIRLGWMEDVNCRYDFWC